MMNEEKLVSNLNLQDEQKENLDLNSTAVYTNPNTNKSTPAGKPDQSIRERVQGLQFIREQMAARFNIGQSPAKQQQSMEQEKKIQELNQKIDILNQRNAKDRGELLALYENSREEFFKKEENFQLRIQDMINIDKSLRQQIYIQNEELKQKDKLIQDQKIQILNLESIIKDNLEIMNINKIENDQKEGDKNLNLSIDQKDLRQMMDLSLKKNEEKEEQFKILKNQIDEMNKKYSQIKDENLQLLIEKEQTKEKVNSLQAQVDADYSCLGNYHQEQSQMMKQINSYEEQIKNQIVKIQQNYESQDRYCSDLQKLVEEKNILVYERLILMEEKEKYAQQIDQLKNQLNSIKFSESNKKESGNFYKEITQKMNQMLDKMIDYEKKLELMDKQKQEAMEEKDFWMNKFINLEENQQNNNINIKRENQNNQYQQMEMENDDPNKKKNILSNSNNQALMKKNKRNLDEIEDNGIKENFKDNLIKKLNKQEGTIFAKPKPCFGCGILIKKNQKTFECCNCNENFHEKCLNFNNQCNKCSKISANQNKQFEDIENL